MPTASEIKLFRSLKDKSARTEHGLFAAETPKVVADLIAGGMQPEILFVLHESVSDWQKRFPGYRVESVSGKELERLSFLKQAHEVSAVFRIPEQKKFEQQNVTLILDNIGDPGNMGTILRTAHWFGIGNIICTENSVDVYNPKVVQSTMGSLAHVNVLYCGKDEISSLLDKNTTVCGTYMEGQSLYAAEFQLPVAFIIGSEARGIETLESLVQRRISIPARHNENHPESLNASVAAAIIMSVVSKINE